VGLVGLGGLSEPFLDVFDFTSFSVVHALLVVSGVELKGGVSLNFNSFNLVEGGIELSKDDVRSLDVLTELFPLRSESLAVAAPGGVELDENILGFVMDNLFVVLSYEDLDGSIVLFGDGLRLSVGDEFAILEVLVELGDSLGSEISDGSFPDVFGDRGFRGDDSESGQVLLGDSNELSESLLDSSAHTGVREEDLSLEVAGSSGKGSLVLGVLLIGEEDHSGVSLGEDGLNVIFSELEESGDRVSSHPGVEGFGVPVSRVDNVRLVEGTLDGDTLGFGSNLVSTLGTGVPESNLLVGSVLGSSEESIPAGTRFLSVVDSVHLAGGLGIKIGARDIVRRVTSLLGDPVDNGVGGTASSVFLILSVNKPFKCWESLDIESLA